MPPSSSSPRRTTPGATPQALLERAIVVLRARALARDAFLRWPIARTCLERLAWYVTDRVLYCDPRIPAPAVPLLHVVVRDAFSAYKAAANDGAPGADDDALGALLGGAFKCLPRLVEVGVRGRTGALWDPLAGGPLGEFARTQEPLSTRYGGVDERAQFVHPKVYRTQLAYHLLGPAQLQRIAHLLPAIVDP